MASLVALYQWILDTMSHSPFSGDYHSLATATTLATGSSIPCYSKGLPPSSALRCCVNHLHRILVNDRFPGWEQMGKWDFVARIEDGDEAANRILYECLKGAYIKIHYQGKTARTIMTGYDHDKVMDMMIEKERDMELALKGTRSRGYPLSPEPKPHSRPPPKPHPYTVGWTEGVSREGKVKKEVAVEKGAVPVKNRARRQGGRAGGGGRGGAWNVSSKISIPMEKKPRGAVEARLEEFMEGKKKKVHGRLKNFGRKEKEFLHATPNHRNVNAKGWRKKKEMAKHQHYADDNIFCDVLAGEYGFRDSAEEEVRKKEVYQWILGLGIWVEPKILGLDAEKEKKKKQEDTEKKEKWREEQERKYEERRHQGKEGHWHERRIGHKYSGKTTVLHNHGEKGDGATSKKLPSKHSSKVYSGAIGGGSTISAIRNQKKHCGRNVSLAHSLQSPLQNGVFLSHLAAAVMKMKHGDRFEGIKWAGREGERDIFVPNGTVMKPTTKAQATHNVNKACELFINDQIVDGEVLFRGKEIVEGDLNKAWDLLFKVWEGYSGLGGRGRNSKETQKVRGTVKYPPPSKPGEGVEEEEEEDEEDDQYVPGWRKGVLDAEQRGKGEERGGMPRSNTRRTKRGKGDRSYVDDELLKYEENLKGLDHKKKEEEGVGLKAGIAGHPQTPSQPPPKTSSQTPSHAAKRAPRTSSSLLPKPLAAPYANYSPPSFKDPYTLSLLGQSLTHVTAQQINHVHLWLHRLGFNPYNGGSGRHGVLRDNTRNGVLLCDVLELLEGGMCKGIGMERKVRRRPDNVDDALYNVAMGMDVVRNGRYRIKHRLTADLMEHVKGEKNAIYGLLWEMVQVYPPFAGASVKEEGWGRFRKKRGWRRYTPRQRQLLEYAIVCWLRDKGILNELGLWDGIWEGGEGTKTKSDYDITVDFVTGRFGEMKLPELFLLKDKIFDGTILCALCSKVLGGRRKDGIKGWIKIPKTGPVKIGNIKRVVDSLKGWWNEDKKVAMGSRWLGEDAEDRLYNGDWETAVGLLEDIMRCCDGMMPRPVKPIGDEKPYLGCYAGDFRGGAQEEKKEAYALEPHEVERSNGGNATKGNDLLPLRPIVQAAVEDNEKEIIPSDEERSGGLTFRRRIAGEGPERIGGQGDDIGARKTTTVEPADAERENEEVEEVQAEQRGSKEDEEDTKEIEMEDIEEVEARDESQQGKKVKEDTPESHFSANATSSPPPSPSPFPPPTRSDVFNLTRWLFGRLHIKIRNADALCNPPFRAEEFMSGLLMARIASELAGGRNREIAGINNNPKTRAARVQNCRRAIETLISHFRPSKIAQSTSARMRTSAERIAEGDAGAAVAILLKVKDILR